MHQVQLYWSSMVMSLYLISMVLTVDYQYIAIGRVRLNFLT